MYINAKELFEVAGIQATDKEIDKINDRFYIRNKIVQLGSFEALERIVMNVATINGLAFTELLNNSRKRKLVDTRSEATYLLALLGYRDCEIKRVFKKDHSTISYYRDRVKDDMSINAKYRSNFYKKYSHILESFQITNNFNMN